MRVNGSLEVSEQDLKDFCKKWRVTELSLFGSATRNDFGPDSDVDVLVTFEEGAPWSLYEFVDMQEELTRIFGRDIDIVERSAVEQSSNPFRRRAILRDARVILSLD
jgi:predicted nucleotidyltransferase